MPSVAEASSGLPPVKPGNSSADDEIVTTVAFTPPVEDEPVSPELALVDPVLAERLRAEMVVPELEPEPEPEPEPAASNLHVLRLGRAGAGRRAMPARRTWTRRRNRCSSRRRPWFPGRRDGARRCPGLSRRSSRGPSWGRSSRSASSRRWGRRTAAPTEAVTESGVPTLVSPPPTTSPSAPAVSTPGSKEASLAEGRAKATGPKAEAEGRAGQQPATKAVPKSPAAPPRRFAWAPVDGAVSYRVELFRGNDQVLQATTERPSSSSRARGGTRAARSVSRRARTAGTSGPCSSLAPRSRRSSRPASTFPEPENGSAVGAPDLERRC